MKRFVTKGIILSRTNFGEADRILTFLTPERGKVKAIAKGSRKQKSKLAGGIEPFSISDLTLIIGRGEINTLISSRLIRHFGNLAKELERMNTAAELMKRLNKVTEESTEPAYFELLAKAFAALDNIDLPPGLTELWFDLRLLKQAGHSPNLRKDTQGQKLVEKQNYNFDVENMAFFTAKAAKFNANHIKFLRLCLGLNKPEAIGRINDAEKLAKAVSPLAQSMLKQNFRL